MRTFVAHWLYGIKKAAGLFGSAPVFLRTAEHEMLNKYFASNPEVLDGSANPAALCRSYTEHLDREGILDSRDTILSQQGDTIRVEIGVECPYRQTCTWVDEEGAEVTCFRAFGLAEMLRIAARRDYVETLHEFGVPCRVSLRPTGVEVDDTGN